MLKITFKYKDKYTSGNWNTQNCIVSSVDECKKIYGLGVDCKYKILDVEPVDQSSHS